MFTGIIEEIGHVNNVKKGTASATLTIQAEKVLEGTQASSIPERYSRSGVVISASSELTCEQMYRRCDLSQSRGEKRPIFPTHLKVANRSGLVAQTLVRG